MDYSEENHEDWDLRVDFTQFGPRKKMTTVVNPQRVAVIGLGFVGEPLLRAIHGAGFQASGIDTSASKIERLSVDSTLQGVQLSSSLDAAADSDVFILALPTPVDETGVPDLSAVFEIASSLGKFLNSDQLVVIESTYAPGTTRNEILPRLAKNFDIQKAQVVYSPERINPGDTQWNVRNTPKLVAAETQEIKNRINDIYSTIFEELVFVESFEIAEAAKLLENIYRFVNINFINEFQQNCDALGIDATKVIAAASTKPFGFQRFNPSVGVGGHCIPVAPLHFSDSLDKAGIANGFIKQGIEVNNSHSRKIVEKVENQYIPLQGKKVLVVGITYKPGVADVRHSPSQALMEVLRTRGCEVIWHDPLIPFLDGRESAPLSTKADLALIAVTQPESVVAEVMRNHELVLDISRGLDIRQWK